MVGYGFVSFACFILLQRFWQGDAPPVANAALGLVYPSNDHGGFTYFSAFQATACALMFLTSIPLCFLGFIISPRGLVMQRDVRGRYRPGWNIDDRHRLMRWGVWAGAGCAPALLFVVGPYVVRALNAAGVVFNLG